MQKLRARVAGAADSGYPGVHTPLRSLDGLQPDSSFTRPSHAGR